MKKNTHLFLSLFTHESRALKQSKSLIDSGIFDQINFVVVWGEGLKEYELIDEQRIVRRIKMIIPEKRIVYRLRYYEWIFRVLFCKELDRTTVIQSHSLMSLPVGVIIKFLRRVKLVYDAHELETETHGLKGFRKFVYKLTEKLFLPFVDDVIVVSDSIADWYTHTYKMSRPHVIKNIPYLTEDKSTIKPIAKFREKFSIPNEAILFIFVGGFSTGRGLDVILEAFAESDNFKHIIFMGFGGIENKIKLYTARYNNIHIHPAVSPDEVVAYTENADVGLSLTENLCLNHYFSLPNKVFQYIASGLPIIVSDFPEMGKLVDDYDCGWKVEVDKDSLLQLINSISWEDVKQKKANSANARNVLTWQLEGEKFVEIYKQVLSKQ